MTLNAHYVPRFLTRPWEVDGRKLVYYDFARGKMIRNSSRKVLSVFGLNTRETDVWFSAIESRAAKERDAVVRECEGRERGRRDANDLDALVVLLGAFQAHRSLAALGHPDVPPLEIHVEEGNDWVDRNVVEIRRLYFWWLEYDDRLQLHFPDSGFFAMPVERGQPFPLGFPLTPQLALLGLPLADGRPIKRVLSAVSEISKRPAAITALSVGLPSLARRVIVPPDFVENTAPAELERHVLELRRLCESMHRQAARP